MHLRRFFIPLLVALAASSLASADEPPPRLLLLLTIDQGRGDYLERFGPALSGGLARLVDESVVFTDARHAHAHTVTAAGHAALSTGRHPASSGMVGNNYYDRSQGRWVYCLEDPASDVLMPEGVGGSSPGRSPVRLFGTGLADWVQAASPDTKVYSIGGKDRASILMGGKNADTAYWFDRRTGYWVTSTYYASSYPAWVQEFQRERQVESHFGTKWSPLPVAEELLAQMDIDPANGPFSHAFGRASLYPNPRYYNAVFYSPFLESGLFDFAERLVTEEALGSDDTIDVLALSFASIDTVGHRHGPNSRELLDTVLRLDRELGEFFRFLDETIGLDRIAISLSADHGVAPVPEYRTSRGLYGTRRSAEDYVCFQRAGQAIEKTFGDDDWFVRPLHFNYETLARRNVSRATLESAVKAELIKCPNIVQVWTRTEIEAAGTSGSGLELFANSFHPERSPDLYIVEKEFLVGNLTGTTHGSPYDYDTHVLALVRWPGAEPSSVSEPIHTVDLPVTLAALLGVATPENVDGVDRSKLIRFPKASKTAPRPNIIYILADDLGYGDLSVQGQRHFETPNIDRLASEGIRFTQHYSGSTVCAPSRDALLTGRHTGHTFVRGNKPVQPEGQTPIPAETLTVAEILADAGYRTGAAGKWGLGAPDTEGLPTRQGFDFFYGYNCQREAHSYYPDHLWRNEERVPLDGETYAHDLITEEALDFIRRNQDAPFFLFVPYTIPHAGLDVPEDSMAPFVDSFDESPFAGRGSYVAQAHPKAAYAGMVTRLDRDVGRILALVAELGLDENTVVMFSSDNGPHLEGGAEPDFFDSNGPFRGYKRDLYEGGVRVPLLVRWNGTIDRGRTSEHVSAFWDVLPTLADLAGAPIPDGLDGMSFVPELMGDPQDEHDYLYWEFHEQGGKQAVRMKNWKGVRVELETNPERPMELYDLDADPGETTNVAAEHPELLAEIAAIMESAREPSETFPFPGDER